MNHWTSETLFTDVEAPADIVLIASHVMNDFLLGANQYPRIISHSRHDLNHDHFRNDVLAELAPGVV